MKDIRNILMRPFTWNAEWLVTFISKFQAEFVLQCMADLLRLNRQNTPIIVQICVTNYQKLTIPACIKVFEAAGVYDGMFNFLNTIVFPNKITEADIHFKYIEAAAKINLTAEVERIIRESKSYDPAKVKDFLMDIKFADPKPIMFLCDMHGFVADMTKYFYKIQKVRFIEIYLYKFNPTATPQVIGTLMDIECDEQYVKGLLNLIKGNCPIEELVVEFEKKKQAQST
jgi:clathrin heavy chain